MEQASVFAKKYLEDILSFFGLKVDVSVSLQEEMIHLDVPSTHLNGFLIGSRSETLRALHTLTAAAIQQHENQYHRINIDIANYKKQREERLVRKARVWVEEVKTEGKDKKLEPMHAANRRIIHKLATAEGLLTESMGEGDQRHVVLKNKPSEAE